MQRINLYQTQVRPRRDRFSTRGLGLLLVVLALGLAAISGVQAWRLRQAEAQLASVNAERETASQRVTQLQAKLEDEPGRDARTQRLRNELAAKRALLDYLEEGTFAERAGFSGYLDGLADHVVDGVWLDRIELAAGGDRLQLDGHAIEPQRVPALIEALGQASAYEGRNFRRLAIDRPDDADWRVDFVLTSGPSEDGQRGGQQ